MVDSQRRRRCQKCDNPTRFYPKDLAKHVRSFHCENVTIAFGEAQQLLVVRRRTADDGPPSLQCPLCDYEDGQVENMKTHATTCHLTHQPSGDMAPQSMLDFTDCRSPSLAADHEVPMSLDQRSSKGTASDSFPSPPSDDLPQSISPEPPLFNSLLPSEPATSPLDDTPDRSASEIRSSPIPYSVGTSAISEDTPPFSQSQRPQDRSATSTADPAATIAFDDQSSMTDLPVLYPDIDTVIDDSKLAPYHLVVNQQLHVLICLTCMTCVDPSTLPRHIKQHNFRLTAQHLAELAAYVAQQYLVRPDTIPSIPAQIPTVAIYGLRLERRLICPVCRRAYKSVNTFRGHTYTCRNGVGPEPSAEIGYAQMLRQGPGRRYFPVTIPAPPTFDLVRNGLEGLRQKALDSIDNDRTSSSIIPALTHTNAATAFCRLEGWNARVTGLDATEVVEWVSLSDDDAVLSAILPVCTQYLADVHTTLKVANHAIKKRLAQFNQTVHNSYSFRAIQPSSLTAYTKTFARLVSFLVRLHLGMVEEYPCELTTVQDAACAAFVCRLEERTTLSSQVRQLHEVMWSIVSAEPPGSILDLSWSPLMHFTIFNSLHANGQFQAASTIGHNNAQTIYVVRAVVFHHVRSICQKSNRAFLVEYEPFAPLLSNETERPFSYLAHIAERTVHVRTKEEVEPIVTFTDIHATRLIVSGTFVHLQDIGRAVRGILADWAQIVEKRLLCGLMKIDSVEFQFESDLSKWHAETRQASPNYGVFQDPRNNATHMGRALLDVFLYNEAFRNRYVVADEDGARWHHALLIEFLRSAEEAEARLWSALHLSSGQPARGTEWEPILLVNAPAAIRSVFLMYGRLCLLFGYNKKTGVSGNDSAIVRVPPPEVAQAFIWHMTVIRPLQRVFVAEVFKDRPDIIQRMHTLVFPGLEGELTSSDFSGYLQEDTDLHLDTPIGLREWRHITAAVCSHHAAAMLPEEVQETSDGPLASRPEDEQRGHTTRTAMTVYANSNHSVFGANNDRVRRHIRSSERWHVLIGLSTYTDTPTAAVGPRADPPALSTDLIGILGPALVDTLRTEMTTTMAAAWADYASLLRQSPQPKSTSTSPPNHVNPQPELLKGLRQFTSDANASFKSPQQAELLQRLLNRAENILAVMPTGYGKTMMMLIPAAIFEPGLTTVIITPLDGLLPDLERRCEQFRISHSRWKSGVNENPLTSIVFASVEEAAKVNFHHYLIVRSEQRILARIILEEAHVMLQHSRFRWCMRRLATIRLVAVCLVILTATFPISLEAEIYPQFGVSTYATLRIPGARPEIGYHVHIARTRNDALIRLVEEVSRARETYTRGERVMVFARTTMEVIVVAKKLGIPFYHSQLSTEERTRVFSDYVSGAQPAIASTTSLGNGIDLPNVRHVFHFGAPYDLICYAQESGRAGRDRAPSSSIIVTWEGWKANPGTVPAVNKDRFGYYPMLDMISNAGQCRRLIISQFLDGTRTSCIELPDPNFCDYCREHMSRPLSTGHRVIRTNNPTPAIQLDTAIHRTALKLAKNRIIAISKVLDTVRKGCASCYARARHDYTDHHTPDCPHLQPALTERHSGYLAFKAGRGGFQLPEGYCWFCTLPQGGAFHRVSNGTACRNHDVAKAMIYTAMHDPDGDILLAISTNPPGGHRLPDSVMQWPRWLSRRSPEETIRNHLLVVEWLIARMRRTHET